MTKQDAVRRRFKDLDRKSDGRSIYIYIYIYHDSGDVDLLTEASLRLGPISWWSWALNVIENWPSPQNFSRSVIVAILYEIVHYMRSLSRCIDVNAGCRWSHQIRSCFDFAFSDGERGVIATRTAFLLTAPLFFTILTSNFPTLFVLLNFMLWYGSF